MINIVIPIEPKPAPRPRFRVGTGGKVTTYTQEWYKIYKSQIAFYCRQQAPAYQLPDALFIEINFCKPCDVKSKRYGDIDNLVKGVLDALNGVMFKDDSQVVGVYARKFENINNEISINISYST